LVKSFATLANDDVIWLGPHFKIAIRIEPAGRGIPNQKARSHQPRPRKFAAARARAGHGSWRRTLNAPVLACAFIVIVLIVAIVAAKLNGNGKSDSRPRGNQSPDHSIILSPTPDDKTPAPEDCVKKAAISAMTRLGNEKSGREYSFANPGAIEEIRSLVSSHQNSPALARAIEAIRSDTKVLANFSQKGINPSLLAYAALAETDGGRGDVIQQASGMADELASVAIDIGADQAESSLVVIAAYKLGYRSEAFKTFRSRSEKTVNIPFLDRNIWHYRNQGALSNEAYRFAMKALAFGAVTQDPQCFGINVSAL